MNFSDRLRAARIATSLTQAQAASEVGIKTIEWSKMECGRNDLNAIYKRACERADKHRACLQAIASVVNTTIEDLIGDLPAH